MKLPMQVTFRNMDSSETIEEFIREEAAKLDRLYNRVMGCRVAVEVPHRHHRNGSAYHIRIDLTVPGEEIVVKREPSLSHRAIQLGKTEIRKKLEVKPLHKNLRLAIKDAFKAARRRLQDYARRQRGDVKSRAALQVARVSEILPEEDHGFLTSGDGRGIYFHRNSVLNGGFSRLKVGTVVGFAEELGDKGPQASTVRIIGKGRIPPGAKQAASSAD